MSDVIINVFKPSEPIAHKLDGAEKTLCGTRIVGPRGIRKPWYMTPTEWGDVARECINCANIRRKAAPANIDSELELALAEVERVVPHIALYLRDRFAALSREVHLLRLDVIHGAGLQPDDLEGE